MAWHDASCANLDLFWEVDRPGCRTCGRNAPELTPAHPIPPPASPPDTRRSELVCTWPPCVAYAREDQDKEFLASIRADIDHWTGEDTTDGNLHTSPTSSHSTTGNPILNSAFERVYEPLPEAGSVRLLRIHGSEATSDPMHCTLEIHRLHDPCLPVFEALSYTWADSNGDSTLSKVIYLGPHYDVLPVTSNCLTALRRFRTSINRLIWVDAICINQFNSQERSHQVSMMRDIYSFAARVLVYGGGATPETEAAMELLAPYDHHHPPPALMSHSEIRSLLDMRYFSRIWTVQEVQLAQAASLTVGGRTVGWRTFRSHVELVLAEQGNYFNGHWVTRTGSDRKKEKIMSYLQDTMGCQCGDPRDRVYGLMGLVDDDEQEDLPVYYEISTQQLYTGLAAYWLSKKQYEVLDYVNLPRTTPFLPSWVPDWAAKNTLASTSLCEQVEIEFSIPRPPLTVSKMSFSWTRQSVRLEWRIDPPKDASENLEEEQVLGIRTEMGILKLGATHILAIHEGTPSFHGPDNIPLETVITMGPHLRAELDISDLFLYRLVDCPKTFFMRRHAKSIFSIYKRCIISFASSNQAEYYQGELLFKERLHEKVVLENWLANMFHYGFHTYHMSRRAGPTYGMDWGFQTPLSAATARQLFRVVYSDIYCQFGNILTGSQFRVLNNMRSSIIRFLTRSIVEIDRKSRNRTRRHRHYRLFDDPCIPLSEDYHFAAFIQKCVDDRISHKPADFDAIVIQCQTQIKRLIDVSKIFGAHATFATELEEDYLQPKFFVQDTTILKLLCAPLLPGDPGRFGVLEDLGNTNTVSEIIRKAHKLVYDVPFDKNRPVGWNLDMLLIHVLTLEMVVNLQELIYHRRVTRSCRGESNAVETISII